MSIEGFFFDRNYGYYNTNPMIKGTFDFLKLVVDNWFKTV